MQRQFCFTHTTQKARSPRLPQSDFPARVGGDVRVLFHVRRTPSPHSRANYAVL
uniref:hypothetical protein n=1 Tax=Hassallia byssoidea TaxID=482630 RepID=UPI001F2CC4B0|nr:hypothetical protein [Hassalia byssoidea]